MGIIYQVKIRCFKVKDVSKVDLNVLSEDDKVFNITETYNKLLQPYYAASKKNIESVLMVYNHDPDSKHDYTLTNIYIPPETNVIAFGNNACDRRGPNQNYYVKFYNFEKKLIEKKEICAQSERNNFMVLVPPKTFFIEYVIGDYAYHSFAFGPHCYRCNRFDSDNSDSD